ncbi:hypothetical protein ACQJBY_035131 [Aegilops geniculata]
MNLDVLSDYHKYGNTKTHVLYCLQSDGDAADRALSLPPRRRRPSWPRRGRRRQPYARHQHHMRRARQQPQLHAVRRVRVLRGRALGRPGGLVRHGRPRASGGRGEPRRRQHDVHGAHHRRPRPKPGQLSRLLQGDQRHGAARARRPPRRPRRRRFREAFGSGGVRRSVLVRPHLDRGRRQEEPHRSGEPERLLLVRHGLRYCPADAGFSCIIAERS